MLLARAIARAPDVLLLDEALQGLDPTARARVIDGLGRIGETASSAPPPRGGGDHRGDSSGDRGRGGAPRRMAIVQVTHHGDEILDGTTHALHLVRGRVAFCGRADAERAREMMRTDERHPWHSKPR